MENKKEIYTFAVCLIKDYIITIHDTDKIERNGGRIDYSVQGR